jgi:hypothetical protein
MVGNIVKIIDPVEKQNVILNDILTAFSVGLAFIPGPEGLIGRALITGAQQAPGGKLILVPNYWFFRRGRRAWELFQEPRYLCAGSRDSFQTP